MGINSNNVAVDFASATMGRLFASGHQRPLLDTLQRPLVNRSIFMSFAVRRLHFALDWSKSCGGQADSRGRPVPLGTLLMPQHRAAKDHSMVIRYE